VTWPSSNVHCAPAGSTICPSTREGANAGPAIAGASQRLWSRAHSHVHAATALSSSTLSGPKVPQPQDHIVGRPYSELTWRAARASHLTMRSHDSVGSRPCRPPIPGVCAEWNPSMKPSRDRGTPALSKRFTVKRIPSRIRRFAITGPSWNMFDAS
jgi:hypothetical protein